METIQDKDLPKRLKNIVLIDDDAICSWLNKTLLESMDLALHITCLSTGREALDYLTQAAGPEADQPLPDLIFLDLQLPDMNGFSILEKLQRIKGCENLSQERIIMLTTSMHLRDLGRANAAPLLGYLVKPLTPTKVMEVFKNLPYSTLPASEQQRSGTPAAPDRLPSPNLSEQASKEPQDSRTTRQP
jgi:CheY-like chemotaxis protein